MNYRSTITFAGFASLAAAHCVATFVLYRARVASPSQTSEFATFLIPTAAAFIGYAVLSGQIVDRLLARLGVALISTFLSFWASLIVAFNTYGT